jgi:protein-serine/threonine kinase
MVPSEPHREAAASEVSAQQPRSVPAAEYDGPDTSATLAEPPGTEPFPVCNVSQANAMTLSDYDALQQQSGSDPFPLLHIRTDFSQARPITPINETETPLRQSLSTASLPRRIPSSRAIRLGTLSSNGSLSPASILSSPQLAAMGDITPLPSPIGYMGSPWRLGGRTSSQSLSRTSSTISRSGSYLNLRTSDSTQILRSASSRSRSRPYPGSDRLDEDPVREDEGGSEQTSRHTRNRSLSEYVPTKAIGAHPRPVAVSGSGLPKTTPSSSDLSVQSTNMHREQYLAVRRGIAFPSAQPPTPPRSTRSGDDDGEPAPIISSTSPTEEIYSVRSIRTKQSRKYRKLCQLGQGTFSQVSLAVRIGDDEQQNASHGHDGTHSRSSSKVPQKLVAVKIIQYGPAGGADEDRVEVSLKREVDILQSINHPSLVQLKAFGSDEKRALLVLDYCPGGDLFEFATSGVKPLGPRLIRRIFAELVAAVRYLHAHYIVHRDIKLESK